MLKIRLTSGLVGTKQTQRRVVRALGLKKFGSCVEHADTPTIRGMVNAVHHLVTVTCCEGEKKAEAAPAAKTEKKAAAPKAKKEAAAAK